MSPNDYAAWSNADLVNRVIELERQLHAQNAAGGLQTDTASSVPPRKKQRKTPKHFDASKYSTRLIALKFAYLGGNYNGLEYHSNNWTPLPTIEEEIWKALNKTKLIFPTRKPGESEDEVSWEGCEYSKCGRTDRGVSAFGQVIGVRVRSNRPKPVEQDANSDNDPPVEASVPDTLDAEESVKAVAKAKTDDTVSVATEFDPVKDELPYIQLINRVLPPDIRVLAWCPNPPPGFSARFNCKERRYRYFFTNPAFSPVPGSESRDLVSPHEGLMHTGWLDIEAMQSAAVKYEGVHDFRNFCKADPSKQITNFQRRIFHAAIHKVGSGSVLPTNMSPDSPKLDPGRMLTPELYYFEVRGSAFLWHQVRHLVAMLFLVGQGYEKPSIIDELLDIQRTPAKPVYDMASDVPLVLWDCIFPDPEIVAIEDHAPGAEYAHGYQDAMNWIYVGDVQGGRESGKRPPNLLEDGKYGRNGIMDDLWALWRKRKLDETLAWSLMETVMAQGRTPPPNMLKHLIDGVQPSARIFEGSEVPRVVGKHIPVSERECTEEPDALNARWAARKGWSQKTDAMIDQ